MKIKMIGYNHEEKSLIVKFEGGKVLKHSEVNESEYLRMKDFSNKEEAYDNFLKSKLPKKQINNAKFNF